MAGRAHRAQDHVQVLAGEAEGDLSPGQVLVRAAVLGSPIEAQVMPSRSHVPYGARAASSLLISSFESRPPRLGIDRDHLARAELAVLDRHALGNIDESHLRSADHEPVRGGEVAKRAQAVPVEPGTDDLARRVKMIPAGPSQGSIRQEW